MNFFTRLFVQIDLATDAYINTNVALAAAYAQPFIISFATILIITVGLALLYGKTDQPATELLTATATIVIVLAVATNIGVYNVYLKNLLIGLPDELIGLAGGSSVGEQLDDFGDSVLNGTQKMFRSSSGVVAGLKAAVASFIIYIIWIVMSVAALLMLLLSKIGLAVLVSVGPVFVGLAIHPFTREYFTKWLSYCTNFAFLALLVGGILNMISEVAGAYFDTFAEANGQVDFVVMAAPAIIMGAIIGIFSQLPTIASSLGGGIGLSAGNFAGAATSRLTEPARRAGHKATGGEAREIKRNAKVQEKTRLQRQNIARKRTKPKPNPKS